MGKKKKERDKYFVIDIGTASAGFFDFEDNDTISTIDLNYRYQIDEKEFYLYDCNNIKRVYHVKGQLTEKKIEDLELIPYFVENELPYKKLMIKQLQDSWVTSQFANIKNDDYGTQIRIWEEKYQLMYDWAEFLCWHKINFAINWCEKKGIPYRVITDINYKPEGKPGEEWRQRVLSKIHGLSNETVTNVYYRK